MMGSLETAHLKPETVRVSLDVAYLLHVPPTVGERTLLVLTLHGFGSNPEVMLRLSVPAVGEDCIVASLRAPNQAYAMAGPPDSGSPAAAAGPTSDAVAYNWGTRSHPEVNIKLHHEIVRAVAAALRARFSIPACRTVLMGFSQPVGLNYRFIGTYPEEAGGVIAICGGVPKDWAEEDKRDKYHPVTAPILHISRSEDEYFPADFVRGFPDRLRVHAADVEFHLLPGKHRFPSKATSIIRAWRDRVFGP
jgi:predicted esterase